MKHTKGPWKYIGWDGQMEIRTEDNKETGIAFLGNTEDGAIPNAKTRANAHLIAAAPELLEALKRAKSFIDEVEADSDDLRIAPEYYDEIFNAINKAEGAA